MSDLIDRANERAEQDLQSALLQRKPVPTKCEICQRPCVVLSNGARSRYCQEHLIEVQAQQVR